MSWLNRGSTPPNAPWGALLTPGGASAEIVLAKVVITWPSDYMFIVVSGGEL